MGANVVQFSILGKVLIRDAYPFDIMPHSMSGQKLIFSSSELIGLSPTLHNVGALG